MFATASGLLGCTPSEVTDGQPFYGVDEDGKVRNRRITAGSAVLTSSKYIFLPFPCWMNQFRSFSTKGHALSAGEPQRREKEAKVSMH